MSEKPSNPAEIKDEPGAQQRFDAAVKKAMATKSGTKPKTKQKKAQKSY